jgi:hypothetical protein
MSASISRITNADTFGTWVTKTNDIMQELETTIQTGGSTKNAAGNIYINGHISTSNTVFADTIDVLTATGTLDIAAPVKTAGKIEIDNTDNISSATGVEFKNNNTTTWEIFTSEDHADLYFSNQNGDRLTIEGTGAITATNLTIDNNILPATISQETLNATVGGTFESLTISGATPITGQISDITNHDTSNLSEDPAATTTSGTMYFTEARARNAISADGSLSYNAATGVISFTERTDDEVKALITSGTGVNVTDGVVSIGQSVGTGDNVSFGEVAATFKPGSNWSIVADATKLYIKWGNTTVFSIDTSGNVSADANITAYGNP